MQKQLVILVVCLMTFSTVAQETQTANSIVLRGHTRNLTNTMFSPDGRRVVTASLDNTARLWDAADGKEIAVLKHDGDGDVRVAAFSADSARFVTVAPIQKIARVWNASDGKLVATLRGHDTGWMSAAFSPDGKRVVTASIDNTTRIWDAATGKELFVLQHGNGFSSPAFSPDGKRVLTTGDDNTARLWNAADGKELTVLRGHERHVVVAAFSPDGKRVVTVVSSGAVRIWDADTGKELHILKGGDSLKATAAVFSPDSKRLLTTSDDFTARLWDVAAGKELAAMDHLVGPVLGGAFSLDGKRVITTANNVARVWDAATGEKLAVLAGNENIGGLGTFSHDWKRVITHPGDFRDYTARIVNAVFDDPKTDPVDLAEAKLDENSIALRGHERSIHSAVFSPDSTRVLTWSGDGTSRVWDAATGKELTVVRSREGRLISGMGGLVRGRDVASFGPGGKLIVTSRDDNANVIRVRDVDNDKELAALQAPEVAVYGVTFSPDGKRVLAVADDLTARVWDVATGKELVVIGSPPDWRRDRPDWPASFDSARFSPDGKRIVTVCSDGVATRSTAHGVTVRLWDGDSGKEIAALQGKHAKDEDYGVGYEFSAVVSFRPDGKRIVTARHRDGLARVWNADDGEELRTLGGHDRRGADYAEFTPDGKRIVTAGSMSGDVRVWNADTGEEIRVLRVPGLTGTALSPDGKFIVTRSGDNTIRFWNADDGKEHAALRLPDGPPRATVLSPDGKHIVTIPIWGKIGRLWNVETLIVKPGGE